MPVSNIVDIQKKSSAESRGVIIENSVKKYTCLPILAEDSKIFNRLSFGIKKIDDNTTNPKFRVCLFDDREGLTKGNIIGWSEEMTLKDSVLVDRLSRSIPRYMLPYLSHAELRLLLYICDRTVGWGKVWEKYAMGIKARGECSALNGCTNGTGLKERSTRSAMKDLLEKNLIKVQKTDWGIHVALNFEGMETFIYEVCGGGLEISKNNYISEEDMIRQSKKKQKIDEETHAKFAHPHAKFAHPPCKICTYNKNYNNKNTEKIRTPRELANSYESAISLENENLYCPCKDPDQLPLEVDLLVDNTSAHASKSKVTKESLVNVAKNHLTTIHTQQKAKALSRVKERGINANTLRDLWFVWLKELYPNQSFLSWSNKTLGKTKQFLGKFPVDLDAQEFFQFCLESWPAIRENHFAFINEKIAEEKSERSSKYIPELPDMDALIWHQASFLSAYNRKKHRGGFSKRDYQIYQMQQKGYSLQEATKVVDKYEESNDDINKQKKVLEDKAKSLHYRELDAQSRERNLARKQALVVKLDQEAVSNHRKENADLVPKFDLSNVGSIKEISKEEQDIINFPCYEDVTKRTDYLILKNQIMESFEVDDVLADIFLVFKANNLNNAADWFKREPKQ